MTVSNRIPIHVDERMPPGVAATVDANGKLVVITGLDQALTSSGPDRHNHPHRPGQAAPKVRTGADRSVTERNAQD